MIRYNKREIYFECINNGVLIHRIGQQKCVFGFEADRALKKNPNDDLKKKREREKERGFYSRT